MLKSEIMGPKIQSQKTSVRASVRDVSEKDIPSLFPDLPSVSYAHVKQMELH